MDNLKNRSALYTQFRGKRQKKVAMNFLEALSFILVIAIAGVALILF